MKRWEMTDMELICALRILGAGMIPGLEDPLGDLPEEVAARLKTRAEAGLTERKMLTLGFDGDLQLDAELAAMMKEAAEIKEWDVYLRKTQDGQSRFFASDHIFLKIGEDGAAVLYEAEDAREEVQVFFEIPDHSEMQVSQPVRINTELLRKGEAEAIVEAGCPPEVLMFFVEAADGEGEEWQRTHYEDGAEPESRSYLTRADHIMQMEMEYDLDGEWLVLTPAIHDSVLPPVKNIYDVEANPPEIDEEEA